MAEAAEHWMVSTDATDGYPDAARRLKTEAARLMRIQIIST